VTALVVFLLLLEARGRPLVVVHDLLPLALRSVDCRCDCFLVVCVVAHDVEELSGRTRCAVSESVDEGGTGHAVLECRDGVVVGYVTRVRVRVSDTIRIGYADTHFLKRKPTKMVYPSIRMRVSGEYRIRIRHPLWSIRVT
jgi:hypothetical protein